jgi:hypothetical protein
MYFVGPLCLACALRRAISAKQDTQRADRPSHLRFAHLAGLAPSYAEPESETYAHGLLLYSEEAREGCGVHYSLTSTGFQDGCVRVITHGQPSTLLFHSQTLYEEKITSVQLGGFGLIVCG